MGSPRRGAHGRFGAVVPWLVLSLGGVGCDGSPRLPAAAGLPDATADGGTDAGPCAPPLVPTGGCRRDDDCGQGVCRFDPEAVPADQEPVTLACALRRDGGAPAGAACTVRADCARGLCVAAGRCVAPCRTDGDCPDGARCQPVWVRTAANAMQPVPACVPRTVLPPGVEVRTERLPRASGDAGRGTLRLPGADAPTLYVLEVPPGARVRRLTARSSGGAVLFDAASLTPGGAAPRNPVRRGTDVPTVLLPNGPRSVLSEQGYELALEGQLQTAVVSTRLERSGGADELALDVFLVGARNLDADGVEEAVANAGSLLSAAGIALGEVRAHELVGGLKRRLRIVDRQPGGAQCERRTLLRLSAGVRGPSVSVFLVRSIDGPGNPLLGYSGGTPGPQGVPGTPSSGVALSAELLEDDLGRAMAHELGHHLGLFHTTEPDGVVLDPLPDTPRCDISRDEDPSDGMLSPGECRGAGADNLMFWSVVAGTELTSDQAEVLTRAPILQRR